MVDRLILVYGVIDSDSLVVDAWASRFAPGTGNLS